MEFYDWFKIDVLYKVTSGFESDEELSEVERLQLKNEGLLNGDEYERGVGIFNLGLTPIKSFEPCCFVPKGKQYKKYYTAVIFDDGTSVNADCKPLEAYQLLKDYYKDIPDIKE